MTATEVMCPICGARLVAKPAPDDAAAGASTWLGRCENQHWWFQSPVFGWIAIDPGAMAVEGATLEDEGTR